jgi:hypothetical protein
MRALIVVESMFDNTRHVAAAITEGLAEHGTVDVVDVADGPPAVPDGVDLVVVGGPTHAHGMTTPDSRRSAARRAASGLVPFRTGIREWLAALEPAPRGVAAAAFDTRIKGPALLWGSAARGATAELRRLGFEPVAEPASFLVKGPLGPVHDVLVDGELERARAWGEHLGAGMAVRDERAPGEPGG